MPKIPTFRRQRIPSGSVGAAPRSTSAAVTRGEQVGAGLQTLGKFLANAGQQMEEARVAEEVAGAKVEVQSMINSDTLANQQKAPSETVRQGEGGNVELTSSINKDVTSYASSLSPNAQRQMTPYIATQLESHRYATASSALRRQASSIQQQVPQMALQTAAMEPVVGESTYRQWAESNAPLMGGQNWLDTVAIPAYQQARAKVDMNHALRRASTDGSKESIAEYKKLVNENIFDPEKKDAAIAKLDEAIGQRYYGKILDEAVSLVEVDADGNVSDGDIKNASSHIQNSNLSTPDKLKMLNQIEGYVSGQADKAKQTKKQNTRQSYQGLNQKIVAGTLDATDQNALAYEDVLNIPSTVMSNDDKEKWLGTYDENGKEIKKGYIQGMYAPKPTETSYDSYSMATQTVNDVAHLQVSPTDAYDKLLTARFVDMSITQKDFDWAMDKIDNPYPKVVADPLEQTVKANKAKHGFHDDPFYSAWRVSDKDKEVEQDVNTKLYEWVDNEIKNDRQPTQKEMEQQSQYFQYGNRALVELGQVVNRGELE